MKKLFVLVVVILFLGGCSGATRTRNANLIVTETEVIMNTRAFDGTFSHTLFLTADTQLSFESLERGRRFDIDVTSDVDDFSPLYGNSVSGTFNVSITDDGNYTITVTGRGRFSISWE